MNVDIQMVGSWKAQVHQMMQNALAESIVIMGRTGDEACKHAIILMAQSARAIAKQSRARRPILKDQSLHGAQYVETYKQRQSKPSRVYKFKFGVHANANSRLEGTWQQAQIIKNKGLAKRSWMWGLAALGGKGESRAIPGTSRLFSVTGETVCGYIKQNKLAYIEKAMPAGWEQIVELRAANKIMAQAARTLERKWQVAMNRNERQQMRSISDFFLKVA